MFYFTMLGYIFGIDCQTTLQVQAEAYKSLACRNFVCNYVVIVVSGYWASCPDRFSLGQISELLLLTKESYCNVKLKCPDTGQHTVSGFSMKILISTQCCSVM